MSFAAAPASSSSSDRLSWHIPAGMRMSLRTRMLRVIFPATIVLAIAMAFGTNEMRLATVGALVPVTAVMLWWIYRDAQQAPSGADNVALDVAGFHWQGPNGEMQTLPRDTFESYRIGLDADTLRAIPSLTLLLVGGFESQPVELHSPIQPSDVRAYCGRHLELPERTSQDDPGFARRLYHTLDEYCQAKILDPEARLLLLGLIMPQQQPDGRWLVARIPECCSIEFDAATCLFGTLAAADRQTDADKSFEQVLTHLRENAWPVDGRERRERLARINEQLDIRHDDYFRHEAQQHGFWMMVDEHGELRLEGSLARLRQVCDEVEQAADTLQPAPLGARPRVANIGSQAVGLKLVYDEQPRHDESGIWGPPEYLRRLAASCRSKLADCEDDDEVTVRLRDAADRQLVYHFHIRPVQQESSDA